MRVPWPAVAAGVVVAAVGAVGLVRGAVPQSSAASTGGNPDAPPLIVSGAYVRAPVPPVDLAATYFTVTNNTGQVDRLTNVVTGAGAAAEIHAEGPGGAMSATGAEVPAHGKLTLSVGKGHVMIEKLYGPLKAGQTVNLDLTFANAGSINVVAPVVGLGAPVPTGGHS